MTDTSRLIEHAFPLKQTSLDSVHEKNVRHGHISTLHIWPARRPLAACRAALIATLLPDPGTPEARKELCEKIGGKLVKKMDRKKMPDGSIVERMKEETEGGILHWGRETSNKETLEWFRQEIKKAYGGRAPKVLDPFAGGGAIPLEAMRLGCETTAVDINPVAWFILKCTLEYPQKLAGQTQPLPDFILENEEFMEAFYKAHPHLYGRTKKTKKQIEEDKDVLPGMVREDSGRVPKADLAWHVRAWGQWVLDRARRELARFYPTYADFEPLKLTAKDVGSPKPYEKLPMQLTPLNDDGTPDIESLNKDFSALYLKDKCNPRWVAKPTVAYLWARTVLCKNCRGTIPLLKTRWLCKKNNKRVLLAVEPNADKTGVVFSIEPNVAPKGGNAAQKREYDKRIGAGTMSRSGAKCPCCGTIMTGEDLRLEGKSERLGQVLTSVITESSYGKIYRLPTAHEVAIAQSAESAMTDVFKNIPFGELTEPTPQGGNGASRAFSVQNYGWDQWRKLFSSRQLLVLGTLASQIRNAGASKLMDSDPEWRNAIVSYLAMMLDKTADYGSMVCTWHNGRELIGHTFARFALPITWDNAELAVLNDVGGSTSSQLDWMARYLDHALAALTNVPTPKVMSQSSTKESVQGLDAIITDPPYYDAIPYSDCMDFFYVWLRRSLCGVLPSIEKEFSEPLSPKWSHETGDGELIDDSSRHGGNAARSKQVYEDGMAQVFQTCHNALNPDGRLVVVFAHKHPNAWETLVSAIIRAGFVVDGSWPIQTEMGTRMRAMSSAALSSSVWMVCKKRPADARPGWDNRVHEEMRENIRGQLREFWDAGIRGPDFVWAATGPAMEAYSKHPVVKKANEPGPMTVGEFLNHVRRMVVDFVVGRVLSGDKEGDADMAAADRLDEPTAYYLLHRHDFGMDDAPAGACILYAVSCGLSDRELAGTWDLIAFTKGAGKDEEEEEADADAGADAETDEESGNKVKLKTWAQRKGKSMGYDAPGGKTIPLIDRIHCLMHLWKSGDLSKVDGYLDENGLRRQELFKRLLQSIIELSPHGSEERSLLESISNHVGARGATQGPVLPQFEMPDEQEKEP
jgi:putative DNA methylase